MKYIARIISEGPLSFRAGRDTNTTTTLDYIPGSALFGGLATTHSLLRQDAAEFDTFFMDKDTVFSNLYPADFNNDTTGGALAGDDDPVSPFPTTASTCKRFGGFKFDAKDDPHHGVWDNLIAWTLFELSGGKNINALKALKDCPVCKNPMDRFTGYYRMPANNAAGTSATKKALRTRTGINRSTGTVEHSILYNREIIQAKHFWGTISIPDHQAQVFEDFVDDINEKGMLRLGNNRTRGFGKVTLQLNTMDGLQALTTAHSISERIKDFNTELQLQAQGQNIDLPHQCYIPITLTSDAIILDHLLRYQTAITPGYLEGIWGLSNMDLVYHNSGTHQAMSWNNLLGLPKADEIAINKGSVFLLGTQKTLDDNALQTLSQMQSAGIGTRQREGYGQIYIANPFHWEVKGL